MKLDPLTRLIGGLALAFLLPWTLLILVPYVAYSNLEPIPYAEGEGEPGASVYPEASFFRHGASDWGRSIYAAEGCAYCHTQVVRPTYAGPDIWREGWGGREDVDGESFTRETRPRDFMQEPVALLGYQRIGQDLSNVGHRITSRELMHRYLSDPKSLNPNSGMPAYRHLYRANPYGDGVVPTAKAEALVDYLLSLRKDQAVPAGH